MVWRDGKAVPRINGATTRAMTTPVTLMRMDSRDRQFAQIGADSGDDMSLIASPPGMCPS